MKNFTKKVALFLAFACAAKIQTSDTNPQDYIRRIVGKLEAQKRIEELDQSDNPRAEWQCAYYVATLAQEASNLISNIKKPLLEMQNKYWYLAELDEHALKNKLKKEARERKAHCALQERIAHRSILDTDKPKHEKETKAEKIYDSASNSRYFMFAQMQKKNPSICFNFEQKVIWTDKDWLELERKNPALHKTLLTRISDETAYQNAMAIRFAKQDAAEVPF